MNTAIRSYADTPARWQKALDRAIANALDVLVNTDGSAFVESASQPGLLYAVSRETCTCPAGEAGDPVCQHRACYRAQCGELPLDPLPAPAGVQVIADDCGRLNVLLDGAAYGHAVALASGRWMLYEGFGPAARLRHVGSREGIERVVLAHRAPAAAPIVHLPVPVSAALIAA